MKICTIVGARPQFIKAAIVSATFRKRPDCDEIIIHTGQHYDPEMSDIFFSQMRIPDAAHKLDVGSGSHGAQTGRMLERIEEILVREKPDWTLVYGDTNSTLAGALAAVKLHIPVAHVEAGMRSFNRRMPEEINRILTDHAATLNFCSCTAAVRQLETEGLGKTAREVGDVMYDCCLFFAKLADGDGSLFQRFSVNAGEYALFTCHRAENTDSPERLRSILDAVNAISEKLPVLFPVHPRTRNRIRDLAISLAKRVLVIPPVGYLEMISLEKQAKLVITDSGGIQKEAFFLGVPCITARDETEWTETVDLGWNRIAGADSGRILEAASDFLGKKPAEPKQNPYGNGHAAEAIMASLLDA
jgi:UDP-GlcNAc3NAcA epimerase